MKIRSERDKRTYLIIALCLVLVVMGVGYAAFSSLLTINGTANISNSWCVGFDNTKTNTMQITKGVSTGSTPTGSISYSGTACGSNLVPNSSLSAHFYQPGDQIEYTLTITNKSSVTAAIKSILVDNESVTSDTTKNKDNITYIIEMPEDTTLAPNASTTMTVTARFQNETDVTGPYSGETKTIEVKINAEQDDGNGGMDVTPVSNPFTGTIYRYNTTSAQNGDSIVLGTKNVWCEVHDPVQVWCPKNEGFDGCENWWIFETESECNSEIQNIISQGWIPEGEYTCVQGIEPGSESNSCVYNNYGDSTEQECLLNIDGWDGARCEQGTVTTGVGNYTTDVSTLNKTIYLKHDVVEDIITASYVCFVYNNTEHCMKGGVDECLFDSNAWACTSTSTPVFDANTQIIRDYQSFYNLGAFSSNTGGCFFDSSMSYCYEGAFSLVDTRNNGEVSVFGSDGQCGISYDGSSSCIE